MMNSDELRALADALIECGEDAWPTPPEPIQHAADYLCQCADKEVAATVYVAANGEKPLITGWDTTAFAAGEEVALYTRPAPAAPQADMSRMIDALQSIRAHVANDPSALAAAIVATCDSALSDAPQEK